MALALRHVCLAAPTVSDQLEEAVAAVRAHPDAQLVILLRNRASTAFRGLYRLSLRETAEGPSLALVRVAGGGPALLTADDARAVFKFDTAGKRFAKLPPRAVDSADAIALR